MDNIFAVIKDSKKANQQAADLEGRSPFTCLGIVTENEDPTNKRRIKVTLQSKGGQVNTDWLWRSLNTPSHDPPLPKIGQTVEVSFIDGDPHKGSYGGVVMNEPNPERAKTSGVLDDWLTVEGNQTVEVGGDRVLTTEGKWDITTKGKTFHKTELVMEDLFRLQLADTLPGASEEHRGKMAVIKGVPGERDRAFICLKSVLNTYSWKEFANGG